MERIRLTSSALEKVSTNCENASTVDKKVTSAMDASDPLCLEAGGDGNVVAETVRNPGNKHLLISMSAILMPQ
jgi:hypothetical protein